MEYTLQTIRIRVLRFLDLVTSSVEHPLLLPPPPLHKQQAASHCCNQPHPPGTRPEPARTTALVACPACDGVGRGWRGPEGVWKGSHVAARSSTWLHEAAAPPPVSGERRRVRGVARVGAPRAARAL